MPENDIEELTNEPEARDKPDERLDEPTTDQTAEPKTFPREYVEELRHENGKYRQRAQKADAYGQRLHTQLVRATGKLA